jgi:hypothetical protein
METSHRERNTATIIMEKNAVLVGRVVEISAKDESGHQLMAIEQQHIAELHAYREAEAAARHSQWVFLIEETRQACPTTKASREDPWLWNQSLTTTAKRMAKKAKDKGESSPSQDPIEDKRVD